MTRRGHRFTTTLLAAVALTACGQGHSDVSGAGATTGASSAPPAPTATTRASTSPAPAPPPLDDAGPDEGDASPTSPDVTSAQQAQTRAGAFMRAFARTDLPQQQWWEGLAGYFTPAARAVYQSTDVTNVPVHKVVEGSAKLRPDATKFRADITVDTDAGTYTVTMIRAGGDWLVDRATPPKQ